MSFGVNMCLITLIHSSTFVQGYGGIPVWNTYAVNRTRILCYYYKKSVWVW